MTRRGITPEQARQIRKAKGLVDTKLQKARLKAGLSQLQLAQKTGVPVRNIQCYEQRERPIENAKLETLCKLCIGLNCNITDILENAKLIELYKISR